MGFYSIAVVGHSGGGKTSLGEAMLFGAGAISKLGGVDGGNSVLDWEAEEKEHRASTQSALAFLTWNGHQFDIVDTPGSMNFIGSTVGAIRVADGVVMVASAEPGIQSEMELLWTYLERQRSPRVLVINKLDREQANFEARLQNLNAMFEGRLIATQLPWGLADKFQGVIDLVDLAAYDYSNPDKPKQAEIPAELQATAQELRYKLVESAAECDDELLEKYLETEQLTPEEIRAGLTAGTRAGKLVPVLCASATKSIGIDRLLTACADLLPDEAARHAHKIGQEVTAEGFAADHEELSEFSALVFKTKIDHYAGKLSMVRIMSGSLKPGMDILNASTGEMERPAHLFKLLGKEQKEVTELQRGELGVLPKLAHTVTGNTLCAPKAKVEFMPVPFPDPVLTYAMQLSGKGEEDKLSSALHRMIEEDQTLKFKHSAETGDLLVSGMGQIHLDLVLERLKREFNIVASFALPRVPYRETIRARQKAQGKYKKQTGGRGQYGDCWLELKPNGTAEHLEFHNAIVGGAIPRTYIPAIEKGITEALTKGVVAEYPVIGIDATVYDGSYHDVDSSEMAFKIAGSMALKKAMEGAKPVLLEPIMELEIFVHAEHMGDVMGDINSRRGRVLGMDSRGRSQVVRAEVPMGEMLIYAIDLRAMTSGQGYFAQKFVRYDEVPAPIADKIIKARQAAAAE